MEACLPRRRYWDCGAYDLDRGHDVNTSSIISAAVGVLVLSGCAEMTITNTGNSECEFRVQSDRERCLQNTETNKRALQERRKEKQLPDESALRKGAESPREMPYSMPRNDSVSAEGETYQPPSLSLERR